MVVKAPWQGLQKRTTGFGRLPAASGLTLLLVLAGLLALAGSAAGQGYSQFTPSLLGNSGFAENYEIRRRLSGEIFVPSMDKVQGSRRVFSQTAEEGRVKFTLRRTADHYYLCFINEHKFRFPILSRGTWIIKKEIETGRFVQVKIFLLPEENTFIRIFPFKDRTRMDLYLYGKRLYKDAVLPIPFEQVLTTPFSRIVSMTWASVDWELLFPDARWEEWSWVESMAEEVRQRLPALPDGEDGALSADGQYVRIKTEEPFGNPSEAGLNCSGFMKWAADGIFYPRTGRYLTVEELKKRHLDYRGNSWSETREQERDPYFGLDWTRNIAQKIYTAHYGRSLDSPEGADVRALPFVTYTEDAGYSAEEFPAALYMAASRHPGDIYLASVNTRYRPENEDVVLRQHVHVAVVMPYFETDGTFRPVVFERNRETSVEDLLSRYPEASIHLVRIPVLGDFNPPEIPPAIE